MMAPSIDPITTLVTGGSGKVTQAVFVDGRLSMRFGDVAGIDMEAARLAQKPDEPPPKLLVRGLRAVDRIQVIHQAGRIRGETPDIASLKVGAIRGRGDTRRRNHENA